MDRYKITMIYNIVLLKIAKQLVIVGTYINTNDSIKLNSAVTIVILHRPIAIFKNHIGYNITIIF